MIEPAAADLEAFRKCDDGRPFILVQLLRFTEGGRDKYLQYSATAQPILRALCAQALYAGEWVKRLVAGEEQPWDAIVVVRYPNRSAYVQLLGDPGFRAIADLRRAALHEAVFLPMDDWPGR